MRFEDDPELKEFVEDLFTYWQAEVRKENTDFTFTQMEIELMKLAFEAGYNTAMQILQKEKNHESQSN